MVRLLKHSDYKKWLELAREVEPLFGPMCDSVEFQKGIAACIENGNAFGVDNSDGLLAGIIAIDRGNNEILWLAVAEKFRGNGYAGQLVKKAIGELQSNGDIFVQTFASGVKEGQSARKLYEHNGFVDLKEAGKNPADIDTVVMVRKHDKIVITQAGKSDLSEILLLQKTCYLSEAEIYEDFHIPPLQQTIHDLENEYIKYTFLKAVSEDEIIGSVRGFSDGTTCFVGKLIVKKEFQNNGIGRQLLENIEQNFPACKRYELFTGDKSLKNLYLYHKCGYREFKRTFVNEKMVLIYLEKKQEIVPQ